MPTIQELIGNAFSRAQFPQNSTVGPSVDTPAVPPVAEPPGMAQTPPLVPAGRAGSSTSMREILSKVLPAIVAGIALKKRNGFALSGFTNTMLEGQANQRKLDLENQDRQLRLKAFQQAQEDRTRGIERQASQDQRQAAADTQAAQAKKVAAIMRMQELIKGANLPLDSPEFRQMVESDPGLAARMGPQIVNPETGIAETRPLQEFLDAQLGPRVNGKYSWKKLPRVPDITGTDAEGNPVRVPDVPGAKPYTKPTTPKATKPSEKAFTTTEADGSKYRVVTSGGKEISRTRISPPKAATPPKPRNLSVEERKLLDKRVAARTSFLTGDEERARVYEEELQKMQAEHTPAGGAGTLPPGITVTRVR